MSESTELKHIVLYVDDDQDDLEFVQEAFQQYATNVQVLCFTDGVKALDYLQRHSSPESMPCLVILDVNMPVMTGKEVLVQLRQQEDFEDLRVVLFTTSSQTLDKAFAEEYDAGFVTKPLDVKQMGTVIKQFINHCSEDVRYQIERQFQ
jgi:CheY-like chemotaxis protein